MDKKYLILVIGVMFTVVVLVRLMLSYNNGLKISDEEETWYNDFFEEAKTALSEIGDYEFEYRNNEQFRMYANNADFMKWQEFVDKLRATYADVEFEYPEMFKAKTDDATYTLYTDYYLEEGRVCVWVEKIEGGEE